MKSLGRKLLTGCAISSILAMGINCACALTITDVPSGYWAEGAIVESIRQNYLGVKGSEFRPNEPISRAEFANAVFNIIQREPASNAKGFKDVSYKNSYAKSILTLRQLQIVFGYPDGSFRPQAPMKRSEAASAVANIVRGDAWDKDVLNRFIDKEQVPSWATTAYVNDVLNNVYVNYPKEEQLRPNDYLTRAQAAVLMVKLRYAIDNYKAAYMPDETKIAKGYAYGLEKIMPTLLATNTLDEFKHTSKNTVGLYDTRKVIDAGNIVPIKSTQKIDSKTVEEGEVLTYVSPKDIYSTEGTKLYSQGTKFVGYVDRTEKSYWLGKQNKSYIVFNKAILSDGTEFPIAGVLYSMYNGDVVLEKEKDSAKVEKDANKKFIEKEAAIKYTEKLVPVLKYKENGKDNLFMLLTGDMIIPENSAL